MNREENAIALEFEDYLQEELGISRDMDRSRMKTGVNCKVKVEAIPFNRTTKRITSKVWVVSVFAQAKDGRFDARAKAVYNMRQVGGREGAKRSLSSLLWDSLNEQERIRDQRLSEDQVGIIPDSPRQDSLLTH